MNWLGRHLTRWAWPYIATQVGDVARMVNRMWRASPPDDLDELRGDLLKALEYVIKYGRPVG